MPASMMTACVAFRPNVTGSRIEMPDSGPMPGSTPTSVPTRQPRNAYHTLSGCSATAKPCSRLARVLSTRLVPTGSALEPERPLRKRRLQGLVEDYVGDERDGYAVNCGPHEVAPLDDDEEGEHHQRHGQDEAQPRVGDDRQGGDHHYQGGMRGIAPVDSGERLALAGARGEKDAEQHQQAGHELRHEARAGHGQAAHR